MTAQTKHPTLSDVLKTQDISPSFAEKLCDQVLNNEFDAAKDPISAIIINAFENNDYSDYDGMNTDLDYAISMLQRAKTLIYNATK